MTDTTELSPRDQIKKWAAERKARHERFFPQPQPSPALAPKAPEEPPAPLKNLETLAAGAPTDPVARDELSEFIEKCVTKFPMPPSKDITVEDIQRIVAQDYNMSRADLISSQRTANLVLPRQVAMYLAEKMTKRSLPDIGRRFGRRDHTTVLHAKIKISWFIGDRAKVYKSIRNIDYSKEVDTELAERVARLKQLIEEKRAAKQLAENPTP